MANFVPDRSQTFDAEFIRTFSGAQADFFTAYVSYYLCKDFKISIQGQRNVNNALSNLPIFQTPDHRLTFGWAVNSSVRGRGIHEGAYEHVATMMALGETFHEVYSARIMSEMAQARAGPLDITPHFSQWRALIRHCNGAFASTDFGILVEDFVRMHPFNIKWNLTEDLVSFPIHPKAVAEALLTLGQLTAGEHKQFTVVGSAIIGWVAAVAVWLYDLRIAIFSITGEKLHVSHPDQETQALFIFDSKPGVEISTKPWVTDDAHVAATTTKSTGPSYATSIHSTPFGGRIVWQSLLPRVFGQSFHHLDHEQSKTLGAIIGSAARMFQSLALGEGSENHQDLLSEQNRANAASYGPGLVQTLTNWLPELRRLQGRMERSLKANPHEASVTYVESLSHLRKVCNCGICRSKEDVDETTEGVPPEHGYCLTTLVETIIALGLALSRLIVSPGTYPSRAGIQRLYAGQVEKRLEARGRHWTEHFSLVYGNEWNAPDARRLQNCVQIFCGSRPTRDLPDNLVALSHEGICAYFVTLEKKTTTVEGAVKLVRIVSGHINVLQKEFTRACLGPVKDAADTTNPEDPWEEVKTEHLPSSLFCK